MAYQQGNTSDIARRSLAVALIQLMQTHDFHKISITQLTQTAGVSRMTYYRHYQNKQEILYDYVKKIDNDLPYVDLGQCSRLEVFDFLVNLFEYLKKFELSTQILINQGFESLIVDIFNHSKLIQLPLSMQAALSKEQQDKQYFQRIFASGMLSNTYLHWVKTGQSQSPKQLATWLIQAQLPSLFYPVL